MLPHQDKLKILSQAYLKYLIQRDQSIIKEYLSLNFLSRQQVTQQLKLINDLPSLLYGSGIEVHLFDDYLIGSKDGQPSISPFQFEVSYSPLSNLIEMEKITITIHEVVLENNTWKIASIISKQEKDILINVVKNLKDQSNQP